MNEQNIQRKHIASRKDRKKRKEVRRKIRGKEGRKEGRREQIKNTKGTMLSMCRPIFTVTHWPVYKEYMSYHLDNKRVGYVLGKMFVRKFPMA